MVRNCDTPEYGEFIDYDEMMQYVWTTDTSKNNNILHIDQEPLELDINNNDVHVY